MLDLLDPAPVFAAREILQRRLQERFGKEATLENYHTLISDDASHTDFQVEITAFYRENHLGPPIISAQLPFFQQLVGGDLMVQANPYLRLARPGKACDNIGYHRDTFYGGSPYEISVLVPFVDLPPESSLRVLSGSHILPEEDFPITQQVSEDVVKGSPKHQLGFLYAPKVMDPSIGEHMEAIPLKVGQVLFFSLSTVHGSIENNGPLTRWSSDIRVMNALAPVDLSMRPDYYKPLTLSAVSAMAKEYFKSNERDQVELGSSR